MHTSKHAAFLPQARSLLKELPEVDQLEWVGFDIASDFDNRLAGMYHVYSIPIPLGMNPEAHRQETYQLVRSLWADVETNDRRDHTLVTLHENYLKKGKL